MTKVLNADWCEAYNYLINCTAVQQMIFQKKSKWRIKCITTNVTAPEELKQNYCLKCEQKLHNMMLILKIVCHKSWMKRLNWFPANLNIEGVTFFTHLIA